MAKPAAARYHFRKWFCFTLWSVVCGLWTILSGCAPSYTSYEASDRAVHLLKKEYKIDAKAKLKGATLGACYTIDNLIDSQLNLLSSRLDEMQHVVLTLQRVGLSSEKEEIQFYSIIAQDPITAAELELTGYFLDIKRVRLLDISRNEYFKRVIRDLHFNPEILGENTCRQMFSDLTTKKSEVAMEKYYTKQSSPEEMAGLFFPTSLIALSNSTEYQIQQIETKRIGETKALVLCKTKEYYAPRQDSQLQPLFSLFPQGFQNEYLLVIDAALYPRSIERIISRYTVSSEGRVVEHPLRQIFDEYPNLIPENDRIFIENYTLPTFLVELIERRIKEEAQKDQELSKKMNLRSVQGIFDGDKKKFTFSLVAVPSDSSADKSPSETELFEHSLKTTADILKGYRFKDYDTVNFVDVLSGSSLSIPRDGVDQFRLKKIGINELIHQSSYLTPFNP
jgi:hypothetical protein